MRIKSIIIFCVISSIFLFCLISIWKILATLQGLNLNNFNFQIIFILGFVISLTHVFSINKLSHIFKSLLLAFIFVLIDGYLIQSLPLWYNIGSFLILYFFINKIKKYNKEYFNQEYFYEILISSNIFLIHNFNYQIIKQKKFPSNSNCLWWIMNFNLLNYR